MENNPKGAPLLGAPLSFQKRAPQRFPLQYRPIVRGFQVLQLPVILLPGQLLILQAGFQPELQFVDFSHGVGRRLLVYQGQLLLQLAYGENPVLLIPKPAADRHKAFRILRVHGINALVAVLELTAPTVLGLEDAAARHIVQKQHIFPVPLQNGNSLQRRLVLFPAKGNPPRACPGGMRGR